MDYYLLVTAVPTIVTAIITVVTIITVIIIATITPIIVPILIIIFITTITIIVGVRVRVIINYLQMDPSTTFLDHLSIDANCIPHGLVTVEHKGVQHQIKSHYNGAAIRSIH